MMASPTTFSDTILIVGAHGFLATHLMQRLRAAGPLRLIGIGRQPQAPKGTDDYFHLDFSSPKASEELRLMLTTAAPAWIFHLVGAPRPSAAESVATNVLPAAILLDGAARAAPNASIVLVGSAAEYGIPPDPRQLLSESQPCIPVNLYGATKLAQTHLGLGAAREGLCVAIARPFNLIGPGIPPSFLPGAVVARAIQAIARGSPEVEVGNVDVLRDFVAVEDAADALVRLAAARAAGEIFNICSGSPTSIRHVVTALLAEFSPALSYRTNPALVRAGDAPCVVGSAEKLRSRLGWKPQVGLATSLRATAGHALRRTP
jgi:GDP-4-dehydro-6-deoxy-D-mannose reductase